MSLLKRVNIELGDTGQLHVNNVQGGTLFEISEHGIRRASVILDADKTRFIIRALCKLQGIAVKEKGVLT